jgi:hypothetical protein
MEFGPRSSRGMERGRNSGDSLENRLSQLERSIEGNPELNALVDWTVAAQAIKIFPKLPGMIKDSPMLLNLLLNLLDDHPGQIAMVILPDNPNIGIPLVVSARSGRGGQLLIRAFLPIMLCTLNAIKDLMNMANELGVIKVSSNPQDMLNLVENCNVSVLKYNPKQMEPADYIAIGASGLFYNEVFNIEIHSAY